jgi:hypothetical protein
VEKIGVKSATNTAIPIQMRALKVLIRARRPPANFFHKQFAFSPSSGRLGAGVRKSSRFRLSRGGWTRVGSFLRKSKEFAIHQQCAFSVYKTRKRSDTATILSRHAD